MFRNGIQPRDFRQNWQKVDIKHLVNNQFVLVANQG